MKFHHVGLACWNIAAERDELGILGYSNEGPPVEDQIQKVRLQFMVGGGPRLELIEPISRDSPIQGILRRGTKLYHVAYEVPHLDSAIATFDSRGYSAISPPVKAAAFGMRRIILLLSRSLNLVELIEAPDQPESIEPAI